MGNYTFLGGGSKILGEAGKQDIFQKSLLAAPDSSQVSVTLYVDCRRLCRYGPGVLLLPGFELSNKRP